ncbi:Outer membrane porin F precursor [Vibrio aerogenes CECT 7868]|uniref:Outer membrane porin F n=1 Tax=Vibrio aerogenes CECT 7868 TaxID=1216006 RepID=A0A1M5ZAI6_9VIBR|nr:OmpA family protein [Vibrio aerogenes]SHI21234.1 Outer membrane porin F precursor [Vibrio aerogenes CECT 7868]
MHIKWSGININIVAALLALLLQGCASYPGAGQGGMAEQYMSAEFSPVMPDEPLGPEHGLRFDWQLAKLHLNSLIQEGAKWCFPATVVQAQETQNRIAREISGGLLTDAANDLIILRKRLNKLENQLGYVTRHARCQPPANEQQFRQQLTRIDEIYQLLNSDNQFALNSYAINPVYMGKLAQAVMLLREDTHLSLAITGHADNQGTEAHNEKLAMERARQVKRYLMIFGLEPNRIKTESLGESLPRYKSDAPEARLTNRRVSIEILSEQQTGMNVSQGEL